MSLYGSKFKIGGVPCGLVMRRGINGEYRVVFEREYATLEQVEAIDWDPPEIEGECILPTGYGFEVKRLEYDSGTRCFNVILQVSDQYLGDVTGYQAQVTELKGTIQEQEGTIAQQTTTISEQAAAIEEKDSTIHQQEATIQSQAAAIEEMEAAGTAEQVKAELSAAYEEGVESNG